MAKKLSGPLTHNFKANDIICVAGENNHDLFIIHSGRLLVFVTDGTIVTPLAYLKDGEYLGELSFFDGMPRSAHVIAIEDSDLIRIPVSEIEKQFPPWLQAMAQSITRKLRYSTELVRRKGIRKKNVESIKPLSIERQREIHKSLMDYLDEYPSIKEQAKIK